MPGKKYSSDQALLEGLCKRDGQIVHEIFERFEQKIVNWVISKGRSREEGEDIFQECLRISFQKICKPDFVLKETFNAYLFGVAKNLLRNLQKKKSPGLFTDGEYGELKGGEEGLWGKER